MRSAVSQQSTAEPYVLQVHVERPAEELDIGIELKEIQDAQGLRHIIIYR